MKTNIIIIHGIGKQEEGYSKEFQDYYLKRANIKDDIVFHEIRYSHLLDMGISAYTVNEKTTHNLEWDKLRNVFNSILFDCICYNYTRKDIYEYIEWYLPKDLENITVIAHSMGGIVAYDWLYQSERKIKNFFTMGSPLGLKMVSRKHKVNTEYWLNIVGMSDIIAKLIKIYPADMKQVDRDYICPVGSFLQRKTPLCHTTYWTDDNAVLPIIKKIEMDIENKFDKNKYNKYLDSIIKI